MEYKVWIEIHNNFVVEATSIKDAERQVYEFDVFQTLKHADPIEITKVAKIQKKIIRCELDLFRDGFERET